MNNRVDIKIDNLLELAETQSLLSIAKDYGYSYATLYRRVKEIREAQESSKKEELERVKKIKPISKSSIKLVNRVSFESCFIDVVDNIDIENDLYLYNKEDVSKRIKIDSFDFSLSKHEKETTKELHIGYNEYKLACDFKEVILTNLTIENMDAMIIESDDFWFECVVSKEIDFSKKCFLQNEGKRADITSLISKIKERIVFHKLAIDYSARTIFVSNDLMKRIINMFSIVNRKTPILITN